MSRLKEKFERFKKEHEDKYIVSVMSKDHIIHNANGYIECLHDIEAFIAELDNSDELVDKKITETIRLKFNSANTVTVGRATIHRHEVESLLQATEESE
jgi:hypothetical protein